MTFSLDFLALPVLLLLPTPTAVVTVAAGTLAGLVVSAFISPVGHRRHINAWMLGFNVSASVVAVVAAKTTAEMWPGLAGLAVGLAVWLFVLLALATGMKRLTTASTWREAVRGNTPPVLLTIAAAAVGLLIVSDDLSVPALLIAVAAVVPISSLSDRLHVERRERTVLHEAAERIHRATQEGPVSEEIINATADALGARTVELTRSPPEHSLAVSVADRGWLAVADRDHPTFRRFHPLEAESLRSIAAVAAVALDNEELVAALRDTEAHRAVLMAAAAHDLRSPVATIRGSVETLRAHEHRLDAAQRDRLLAAVSRSANTAQRLIEDLLELERATLMGHATEQGSAVAAAHTVLADIDDTRVALSVDANPPDVAMPTSVLERVLDNLIRNALKHSPPEGSVDVGIAHEDDRVLVSVSDRGPGIPDELRHRLFEAFVQGSGASSGVGLGLHVAQTLAKRHGATLSVDSRPGGGSVFSVAIPAATDGVLTASKPGRPA